MCQSLVALRVALLPTLEESSRLGGTEGPDLTRYFLICGMLLLVTIVVAWGFRRLVAGNLHSRAAKRSLQIIDALPLGGKRRLAVVRCYDRTFVLGIGDREISPIAELDPVTEPRESSVPSSADRDAFAQALEMVRKAMPKAELAAAKTPVDRRPGRVVKKKRRKKVQPPAREENAETVAQAARRIASAKREAAKPEQAAATLRKPRNETPPIQRLEGVLG